MKKLIALLLALVMVVGVLAACNNTKPVETQPKETKPAETQPKETEPAGPVENETPLNVAWYSKSGAATKFDNPQWDMSLTIAYEMIWERATEWDNVNGVRVYTIAESITSNADFTEFTIKLRNGIKWHDGSEVTIEDYIFSLYYHMLNPATASTAMQYVEGYEACKNGETKTMSGVTVDVANNSATFKLTQGFWDFESNLGGIVLLPAKYFEGISWAECDNAEFWQKPIGCGPYQIVDVKFPDYFTLTRFDDYFGAPAGIKNVNVVNYVNSADAMATALMTGNLDFVNRTAIADQATADMITAYNANAKILAISGHGVRCWFFNLGDRADGDTKPDLQKKEVRQAFDILLDETQVADLVGATSSATLVRSNSYDYYKEADARVYDVAAAKALLDSVGFDYSRTYKIAYYYNEAAVHDAHLLIQQLFAAAGVNVEYELLQGDLGGLLYTTKNYDLCMLMCTAKDVTPGSNYEKMRSTTSYTFMAVKNGEPKQSDYLIYHDDRGVTAGWDALYGSYETEADATKRAEISKQMQAKNFDECYALPGYIQATYVGWNEANVFIPEEDFAYGGDNYQWDQWKILK